ncbi:MAG: hypothetical protein CTY15_11190 [Methylocystis sp.]|nr:MAG: hypothetical protein CTY15_11190 [Methylocystis sp.]
MRPILSFCKTTIIGGVVFLLPIAAMLVIVVKAGALAVQAVAPLAEKLPFPKGEATLIIYVAGGLLLVLLSFMTGIIARSFSIERKKPPAFLEPVLEKLPPYVALKKYTDRIAGVEEDALQPALVRMSDGWQVGFIADSFSDGHIAVFLPSTTDATSGGIRIVQAEDVTPLNMTGAEALACLKRSGRGLRNLLEKASAQ